MKGSGPIESRTWEGQLVGRAVDEDGERARLFGYDVKEDLARHYSFGDVLLLALTGEAPTDGAARAFNIALTFRCALSISAAPIHAAMLARLCGVRPGGVLAVSGIALGETSDGLLASIADALELDQPLPNHLRATNERERADVAALAALLGDAVSVPVFARDPNPDVAIVAVLRACGLTTPFQLSCALSLSRMVSAVAEASRATPGDFKNYPIDTPHFEYDPTVVRMGQQR